MDGTESLPGEGSAPTMKALRQALPPSTRRLRIRTGVALVDHYALCGIGASGAVLTPIGAVQGDRAGN